MSVQPEPIVMKAHLRAAQAIVRELAHRRGLLCAIDADVSREIETAIAGIVERYTSEWFPVRDRLPEHQGDVLVWSLRGHALIASYRGRDELTQWFKDVWFVGGFRADAKLFTHWREIGVVPRAPHANCQEPA